MKRLLTALLCACSLVLFVGTGCKKKEQSPADRLNSAVQETTDAAKDAAKAAEKDATKVGEDLKKAADEAAK
jgi:hypothetical protein